MTRTRSTTVAVATAFTAAVLGGATPVGATMPTACPASSLVAGTIATVAGTGVSGSSGDGGPALDADLQTTLGSIAVGEDGTMYLVAYGSADLRTISPDGTIDTVAGPATGAPFIDLWGVALDGAGDIFVTDNGSNRVWMVDPAGTITPAAGSGEAGTTGDGGPALDAEIVPDNIGVSPDGHIYLNGTNGYRVVDPDGTIDAFAGTGVEGFSGDGGPALEATFGESIGVTPDGQGDVYLADTGNERIRRVDADGIITTVAGSGADGYAGDGGPALEAAFSEPVMIAVDDDGTLYVSDHHNNAVRRVATDGTITTVAGTGPRGFSGDCGPATEASLDQPWGIAIHDDVLYILDMGNSRIRMVALENPGTD
jgi:sugar lactone lactonase YvrE